MTPTSRTLDWLRSQHYAADVCERWLRGVDRRRDLFGVLDIVALGRGETIGVQCTSRGCLSSRVKKVRASPALPLLLAASWRVWCVGWGKGEVPRVVELCGADVEPVVIRSPKRRRAGEVQGDLFEG